MNLALRKSKLLLGLFLAASVCTTCRKEVLVFDPKPSKEFTLPLLLSFDDVSCKLDSKTSSLRYSRGIDSTSSFLPYVEFQEETEVYFDGKKLKNNQRNDLGVVAVNRPYTVTFSRMGETNSFQLYFTNLPIVQVITLDKIDTDPKSFGRMIVDVPNFGNFSQDIFIAIETRGGSTGFLEKKSYGFVPTTRINTHEERPESFFGFRKSVKWALSAMHRDFSLVRNKVCYDIWKDISQEAYHGKIETKLVEVFLNYRSLGLYHFHQVYDKVNLASTENSVLVKGDQISEETQFSKNTSKRATRYWNDFEQILPKPTDRLNWDSFQELFELVVEGENSELVNELPSKLDIDNAVDYFLLLQVMQGGDNLAKNWFFYQPRSVQPFQILPWDMDATFGRNHGGDEISGYSLVSNNLFNRMLALNVGGFKTKLKAKWNSLKNNELSPASLKGLFQDNFYLMQTSGIVTVENAVWGKTLNLLQEKRYIEQWIDGNWTFLDTKINSL